MRLRALPAAVAVAMMASSLVACTTAKPSAKQSEPPTPAPVTAAPAPKSSMEEPLAGQKFELTGNIGVPAARPAELQMLEKKTKAWTKVSDATTTPDGSFTFPAKIKKTTTFRVVAAAAGTDPEITSANLKVETHKDKIHLVVNRTPKGVIASALAKPTIPGREYTLEAKKGGSWKQVGKTLAEGKDGSFSTSLSVKDATTFRLKGEPVDDAPGVTSDTMTFAPGPKKLGDHVVSIITDSKKDPQLEGKKFTGWAVFDDGPPLELDNFGVRGNTTATKVKKPYKLKFEDNQKPFGMKKEKNFILLANYVDWTLVRTATALKLGREMDGLQWTADSEFTELYVNGKYRGSYQLVESIKIDKNRIPIDKKTGVIIEVDPHWEENGVPGFKGLYHGLAKPDHRIPYSFRDPDERKKLPDGSVDPEGITDVKVADMKKRLFAFERVLYGKNFKDPTNGWRKYLDEKSAVDYYLTKEFTKDNDSDFNRSNFFYVNNYDPKTAATDKIYMGPIWDFDRSAGGHPNTTEATSPTGWWLRGHGSPNHKIDKVHWFVQLTKDPEFVKALEKRWKEKKGEYKAIGASEVDKQVKQLTKTAAQNDRAMWGTIGGVRYPPKTSSYNAEIAWLKNWYTTRYNWMNKQLS